MSVCSSVGEFVGSSPCTFVDGSIDSLVESSVDGFVGDISSVMTSALSSPSSTFTGWADEDALLLPLPFCFFSFFLPLSLAVTLSVFSFGFSRLAGAGKPLRTQIEQCQVP